MQEGKLELQVTVWDPFMLTAVAWYLSAPLDDSQVTATELELQTREAWTPVGTQGTEEKDGEVI